MCSLSLSFSFSFVYTTVITILSRKETLLSLRPSVLLASLVTDFACFGIYLSGHISLCFSFAREFFPVTFAFHLASSPLVLSLSLSLSFFLSSTLSRLVFPFHCLLTALSLFLGPLSTAFHLATELSVFPLCINQCIAGDLFFHPAEREREREREREAESCLLHPSLLLPWPVFCSLRWVTRKK